jgi:hypothetical protein
VIGRVTRWGAGVGPQTPSFPRDDDTAAPEWERLHG